MSFQTHGTQHMVVYRAHPDTVHHLRTHRDQIHNICRLYVNREVRVETLDGHVVEGTIVNCDRTHLYLRVSNPSRGFPGSFTPFTGLIMPMVLFDLLAIALKV